MNFGFIALLSAVVAVADDENTRWCNHGTSDPALTCDGGQFVYCCDQILNTLAEPDRKQGFPVKRSCGKQGITCTVKNNAGAGLIGHAACGNTIFIRVARSIRFK
ncbi:uncharacterized protein BDZ83DRAFT_788590 [Colletotrichum acutatum]|uniref:Hydrophobin n=1 Tax=Glomerella acutata TaxID=27357 RepID=A0AAD8XMD7_GLOAC|nr:uncharacterized protein BDZ83DRAFT_788590 [Colletotrichum acutatum]KAK1729959.1 hypothetical protein BDZ83DRAFT_788590 [Colletotrichum acutatum]